MVTPVTNSQSTILLNSIRQQQADFSLYLAAQLDNQNPLAPISVSSILQQQLSSTQVQGQLLGNLTLANISNASVLNLLFSVSESVGTTTQYKDSSLALASGQGTIKYKLDSTATMITIDIFDSNGNQVTSTAITALGNTAPKLKGDNTFNLNTLNASLSGNYTYSITAKDANNQIIGTTPFATSQIQSSILNQGVVYIKMANNKVIDANDILQLN